ncbi:hypothetical protein PLESTF_000431300 [Pleodorina starrii]|nr:hypothetical protein PLESTF_000431300 [Pleodorina starrii]
MAHEAEQSAYLILPRQHEAQLQASYQNGLASLQHKHSRELEELREAYVQELERRDRELEYVREEGSKLKQENLAWQRKTVLSKMRLASAEENAQIAQNNLASSEALVNQLGEGKEVLESLNAALQEQVQALTELCQGQHRAQVAQQGQLATTDAEAKHLHEQFMRTYELSELLARQLKEARTAHEGARLQIQGLEQQSADEQAQLAAQAAAHAALQADCEKLRASVAEGAAARAGLEVRIAQLEAEAQERREKLKASEQRLAQARQDSAARDEQRLQELQRLRAADSVIIQDLQLDVDRLRQRLAQGRRDAEEELKLLQARLEREQALRGTLERHCEERSKQLREEQDGHAAALAQLRSQFNDKVAELQQATGCTRRLEEQLAASEKLMATRMERIANLEAALERNTQKLCQHVNSKDAAMGALQEQLEQQRRKLEQKEAELREVQETHDRLIGQLERRLAQQQATAREQEAQLQQQAESARQLQQQAESARRQAGNVEAQMQERIAELQASLAAREERIKQLTLGQADDASQHDRRLRLLQGQLQEQEAELQASLAAREERIKQLMDAQAADASQHEQRLRQLQSQMQERVAALQASLAAREERIKQLTDGQAADASQRDRRLRQLQSGHSAELARLEARIRELEHQLTVMPSPAEPQRNQVRSATAAVDKLMGSLLSSGLGGLGALQAVSEDEEDDDRGPSADLILGMSQPHLSQGLGDAPMFQQPAAAAPATAAAAPAAQLNGQQPAIAAAQAAPRNDPEWLSEATAAAAGSQGHEVAATDAAVKHVETGKRGQEPSAEGEERPAGRSRGRKAAKHSQEQQAADAAAVPGPSKAVAAATAAAAAEEHMDEPNEEPPPDAGPAARAGSRRRAAKTGQARAKAMAAALADDSETDSMPVDTPGFEVKGARTRRAVQRAAVEAAATAAAASGSAASAKETASCDQASSEDTEMSVPPESEDTAAAAKRGRAGARRGKGGASAKGAQPEAAKPAAGKATAPPAPVEHAAAPAEERDAAVLMPPPPGKAAAGRRGAAAAGKPHSHDVEQGPASQEELDLAASQQPTQPQPTQAQRTQPQPQLEAPPAALAAPSAAAAVAVGLQPAGASRPSVLQQVLPTVSSTSIFSQGFMAQDGSRSKNPLATLNPRLLEQAKNRGRIIPLTSIQQWKIQTPSVCKPAEGRKGPAKRPLPKVTSGQLAVPGGSVVPGDALPADMLLRTLQQQPQNKAGARGG